MKKLIFASAVACLLVTGVVGRASYNSRATFEEEVFYYADFEGKVVNANIPPDKVTDFVWAQEYLDCKTETHNGSNMLYMKAMTKPNDYSTLGGFGTGKVPS